MLVLSRKRGEQIVIGHGDSKVILTVVYIRDSKVQLGIEAPTAKPVHRMEVYQAIQKERERGE